MILAGDIGGTKSNLAFFQKGEILHFASFPSQQYATFEEIVVEFIRNYGIKDVVSATFAIAGPVQNGVCRATNLPWVVESRLLQKLLSCPSVYLINDLEANAYALEILPEKSLYLLYRGEGEARGNRAVISPGTGLGEAALFFDGHQHHPFASEGGHTEFGPHNEQELALCRYLIEQFGHASYERLLSGPGLHNIYLFLRDREKKEEPLWLQKKMKEEDPAKVISEEALQGSCAICIEALTLFVAFLGAEAGNCALKFMATGGIYIGGGIPPKILPFLEKSIFMKQFTNKGRLAPLLEKIPIHVILDDKASLLGAAHYSELSTDSKRVASLS